MQSFRSIRSITVLTALTVAAALAAAAPAAHAGTTLGVSVFCSSAGHGRLDCEAMVDGGTAPYSFAWSPTPVAGGGAPGLALIACNAGQLRSVSLAVTDANSEPASASGSFYCGNA